MSSKKGKVLNPFQHALKRPDTYIGSKVTGKRVCWVFKDSAEGSGGGEEGSDDKSSSKEPKIVSRKIKYNPGLTRIFIEVMSNAIDNLWRSQKHGEVMKKIEFMIETDPTSEKYGWITVKNDGYCIPVQKEEYEFVDFRTGKTRKEDLYPVEVFFGEMLAGTNFEEDDTRKTSGRNGMGGKAMVIFSQEAIIEHTNPEQSKKLVQTFSDHGTKRSTPLVTSCKGKVGYTSVSFLPDYEYFDYPGMDEDLFSILKRHVYECSMITGLNISLNGERIAVKSLNSYVRLYYPDTKENSLIALKAPNGDECVLVERGIPDLDAQEDVPHVSWINGIHTRDGGVHVESWKDAIFPLLVKSFNSRKVKKGETPLKTTAKELYPYFTLFVRAEIEGATFDAQTKDCLVGPEIHLADSKKQKDDFKTMLQAAVKKILKWNFIALLEEKLSLKAEKTQSRKEKVEKRVGATKNYTPANLAGTKRSPECILAIEEGLSAKTFFGRIISKIKNGNDLYGSLAIRGKFINVQNASLRDISANAEVQMLKKVMGLVIGVDYSDEDNRKTLKYGKVLIVTDQDDDGFHIRGLLLNFFWKFWPSLFEIRCEDGSPFIESFTTAVVSVTEGKDVTMFYANPEFKEWSLALDPKKLKKLANKIKYLKGLGSHAPEDAARYVKDQKRLQYILDGDEHDYMDLGFNKHQSDWRKSWITRDMPKDDELAIVPTTPATPIAIKGELSLSTFVDTQLIIYHIMSLRRALPNMFDGFKESQRKAFFGVMMDMDARKRPIVVENLAGTVKKLTGYHHGGTSLQDTIVKMMQGFVGSNNIPLFRNEGEIGSRQLGGGDAAAARYISTALEDVAWTIFSNKDEPILKRATEDGQEIEYEMFMPILPLILINGANGIASGYSTQIPCYNPLDIVAWIEAWLLSSDGTVDLPWLVPWYRGFFGTIELLYHEGSGKARKPRVFNPDTDEKPTGWRSIGNLQPSPKKKGWWEITELPVGMWTSTMSEHLEYLKSGNPPEGSKKKKGERCLADVKWRGTTNTIHWEIRPTKDFIPDMEVVGNFKNMQNTQSLTNMHVLDQNGFPKKYTSAEDLLQDFCKERLRYYEMRREYWLKTYKRDLAKETDRYKYVKAVVDKKLNMHQTDEKLEADMEAMGLRKISDVNEKKAKSYDYLLSMQMRSMTIKKLEEIKKEVERLKALVKELEGKTSGDLWLEDLETFKVAYAKFLKTRKEE